MWYQREIEALFSPEQGPLRLHPVWMVLGPRQVGKSSLLKHMAEEGRTVVDLDDLTIREAANRDPALFAQNLRLPLTIDEIQYAPELLSQVKILADRQRIPGSIWITGSQNFEIMQGVRESLAGRVAILNLFGLSISEKRSRITSPIDFFSCISETSFPALRGIDDLNVRDVYLNGYIKTYIERDVQEILGISKRREFEIFVKLCALRTGQLINYESLASDAGVSPATAKQWLSILEDSFLIKIVHPYASNRNKRLVKTPKIYFIDSGLAAYIAGWREPEVLAHGPMGGAFFESAIFGELLRFFSNRAKSFEISFWRSRDGEEIDFIVEADQKRFAIECKIGSPTTSSLLKGRHLEELDLSAAYVATLTALHRDPLKLTEQWTAISPIDL
ncbi:MAG: ATP-binding protein, partial [Pseudomonadota bacterium]